MAMKFYGDLETLKATLDRHDVLGSWEPQPNGVWMLRCADGANLHWAQGNKSLWVDGKLVARERLQQDVAGILHGL